MKTMCVSCIIGLFLLSLTHADEDFPRFSINSADFYFGDNSFPKIPSNPNTKPCDGFQFFLINETIVSTFTCVKDYEYHQGKLSWKIILKKTNLPPPPNFKRPEKADKVIGFDGRVFVTYLDPHTEESSEREILKLINAMSALNKDIVENSTINKTIGIDPITRLTEMEIVVSKNVDGKNVLLRTSYIGVQDTERPPVFKAYETSLFKLISKLLKE